MSFTLQKNYISEMKMLQVKIKGMSCGHCVSSITKALESNQATDIKVDLETGLVSWEGELSVEKVLELADDLGFEPADNPFKINSL